MECKCGENRSSEFYKSNKSKCKKCVIAVVNKRRSENIDKIREYDRNRPNAKERVIQNQERIDRYKTENPKKYKQIHQQKIEWAKRNRHKRNAQQKLSRALLNGTVLRPDRCELCDDTKVQAHHPNYSKPLDVIWLCASCHSEEHKKLREIERSKNHEKI
jgi:hypothetical protein